MRSLSARLTSPFCFLSRAPISASIRNVHTNWYAALHQLMPRKRLIDLYNFTGYHRHGKTEFYRDFVRHLRTSSDRFVTAEGAHGMVMLVFTLPSYDVVFKLIKDRFDYPKENTRADVMRRYRLVFAAPSLATTAAASLQCMVLVSAIWAAHAGCAARPASRAVAASFIIFLSDAASL